MGPRGRGRAPPAAPTVDGVEHPASTLSRLLRRHAVALDVLLGAVIAAVGIASLWTPPVYVDYDFRDPDALGIALAVVSGAGVALRSRWPVPALGVTTAGSLLPLLLGYNSTVGGLSVLLVLYSVAVSRPARTSGTATALTFVLVGVVLTASPFDGTPSDWVVNAVVLVTGWALGRSVRARRAYTAGLEERNRALVAARESETRAALADERGRIAREMQDLVAHSLTAMTVQSAAARRLLRKDPATAEQVLDGVEASGRAALEELRRILGVLQPDGAQAELLPQPGVADLDDLVAGAREQGLQVELVVHGTPAVLDPGVELAAYRIVQEALDNAVAHAGPATVRVTLHWRDDALALSVEDDGRGTVQWASRPDAGHGLAAARERAQVYGGELRAGPRRGGGFCVSATLPTAGAAR